MNRIFKFRLWDGEKMILPPGYDGSGSGAKIYQIDFEGRVSNTNLYGLDFFEGGAANNTLEDVVLMQYTGYPTRENNYEIYEGDIINDDGTRYVVHFIDGLWDCYQPNGGDNIALDEIGDYAYIEGNIYENPELLTNH